MSQVKDKERILKVAREKKNVYIKQTLIKVTDDFSAETLQARKEWHDIFKVQKGNQEYCLLLSSKTII